MTPTKEQCGFLTLTTAASAFVQETIPNAGLMDAEIHTSDSQQLLMFGKRGKTDGKPKPAMTKCKVLMFSSSRQDWNQFCFDFYVSNLIRSHYHNRPL